MPTTSSPTPTAPVLNEDEIRALLGRWEQLSTEDQRRVTEALRALPQERFKALEKEFGLHKTSSGLRYRPPLSFVPKEDLLEPRGLIEDRRTAAQQPDTPKGQGAKAAVQQALNPKGLVAPPSWLMELMGLGPAIKLDQAVIDRLADTYSKLTGRELPADPEGRRAALFRDPAFQAQSPAAAVAASIALGSGLGDGKGTKAEFRYRNALGQERKASLDADAVALAVNQTPGFLPHVQKVAIAAEESGVPWQVVYGVIRALTGWDPGKTIGEGTQAAAETDHLSESDTAAGISRPRPAGTRVKEVVEALDAYYEELGDWGLAVMAISDPEAARQLKATGRATSTEAYKFVQKALFGPNGTPDSEGSIVKLGWDTDGFDLEAFASVEKQVGDKPVQLPDRESLAQQVRSYFKNLLLRDPSQQEIDGFVSLIENQIVAAQQLADAGLGNPYNPDATQARGTVREIPNPGVILQSQLLGSEEGKTLYANKPAWMDESQYVSQVAGQAAQELGETPDDAALRVGLQTGTGDAYTGYLQGRAAGQNTVSFRERLYAASKILNGI